MRDGTLFISGFLYQAFYENTEDRREIWARCVVNLAQNSRLNS